MLQKIKSKILILFAALALAAPLALPAIVSADTIQGGVCGGALNAGTNAPLTTATDCSGAQGASTDVNSLIARIVNIISIVVGIIAVIMIVIGGFRYITSGGKTESVTAAKNTLLYAIIGLVIVALAQIIVRFVLNKATGQTG